MSFKHGRLGELWLNGVDVSNYFASAAFNLKQDTADVTTFKVGGVVSTYHAYIAGLAGATLTASGYYDSSEADKVRVTLQAAVGQLTYMPAGAVAIGDQARLLNINSSDYKTGSNVAKAVTLDWTAQGTAPVGLGEVLHTMQSEAAGTITGTPGTPLNLGVSTTTGALVHVHATVLPAGATLDVKLQDSPTVGGVYADVTGGAIVQMTAVGSQRLVVPGTIRAYVKAVSVVAVHPVTFGVVAART